MRKSTRINAIYRRGNQRGQSPPTEEEINEDRRHLPKRKSTRIIAEEETNEDHRHLHGLGGTTTWTRKNRWIFYGRPLDTASNQSEERHQLIFKFHDAVVIESMIQPCTTQLLRLETYSRPAESPNTICVVQKLP